MSARERLSESQEDYLEAILGIIEEKEAVRAKDIAARLGVTSPSVTEALHSLSEKGLLNYAPYDVITLTQRGRKLAESVWHRHKLLRSFLTGVLGASAKEAERAACRMEHALSPQLVRRLATFLRLTEMCPEGDDGWMCGIVRAFAEVEDPDALRKCIETCAERHRRRSRAGAPEQA